MGADIERLSQYNRMIDLLPAAAREAQRLSVNHVDAFVLSPSRDVAGLALQYVDTLPGGRAGGAARIRQHAGRGANLTSYLLFDRGFCRALLALGFADADGASR